MATIVAIRLQMDKPATSHYPEVQLTPSSPFDIFLAFASIKV
jgi:hypothetical protein